MVGDNVYRILKRKHYVYCPCEIRRWEGNVKVGSR